MADYHIRGGLGTQIMSIFAAYAIAIETGNTVDKFIFNTGNYPPGVNDVGVWFADDFLEFKNRPAVEFCKGTNKTSAFKEPNVSLILKHWERIKEEVHIKPRLIVDNNSDFVLHIRQADRPIVSMDKYDALVSQLDLLGPLVIVSDEEAVLKRYDVDRNNDTTVDDWLLVLNSFRTIGGYSAYTLVAAMLNPNTELFIINRENSNADLLLESDWAAINKYVDFFPNIHWTRI